MGRDYITSLSHLGGDINDEKQLRRILGNIIDTFRSHFLGGTKEKNSKCIEDEFRKIWRNVDFEVPHEEREEDYYIHSRNLQGDNIFLNFDGDCNFDAIPKEIIALYVAHKYPSINIRSTIGNVYLGYQKSLFFTQCNLKKCYQPFDKSSHHDRFNMTLIEDSETAIENIYRYFRHDRGTDFPYVKAIGLLNRLNIIVEAGREKCSIPRSFPETWKNAYKYKSIDYTNYCDNEVEEVHSDDEITLHYSKEDTSVKCLKL
uniref:Ankyrin repeat protein n=1 Tax=Strongyloides venezuelensis TaxID=75913 RepID=A0A0K0FQQ4_STRVS